MNANINHPTTVDKLKMLKKILKGKLPHKFNMRNWYCGTSACALGTAAIHPYFNSLGLKIDPDWRNRCSLTAIFFEDKHGRRHYEFNAASKCFGITKMEAYEIFNPRYYHKFPVPKSAVIKRIDQLITNYDRPT